MRPLFLAAALCASLHAVAASAQPASLPAPGSRVRVATPLYVNEYPMLRGSRWVAGTVLRADSASLTVRADGVGADDELVLPVSSIAQLQVSGGRMGVGESLRRAGVRGAVAGVAVASVALLFGKAIDHGPGDDSDQSVPDRECDVVCQVISPRDGRVLRNEAVAASGGALLGLAFGLRARERWVPVRVAGMALAMDAAGIRVGVRAR
jgi:hypothetical protein